MELTKGVNLNQDMRIVIRPCARASVCDAPKALVYLDFEFYSLIGDIRYSRGLLVLLTKGWRLYPSKHPRPRGVTVPYP